MVRAVAIVVLLAVGAALAAVALAAQSPKALRASIFAAARKQHSLHYVEQGLAPGLRQTMAADIAGTRGTQKISFTLQGQNGQSTKGQFTVRVVKPVAYVRADSVAMRQYLGFTASQTAAYHDKWIAVRPGQRHYQDFAASVTLPSFLHDIYPGSPVSLLTASIRGHKMTGVAGTNDEGNGIKVKVAVFPDSKLRPLAVSDVDKKHGFVDGVKISRWNEPVHVQAPAHAVPIATVLAG